MKVLHMMSHQLHQSQVLLEQAKQLKFEAIVYIISSNAKVKGADCH